MNKTATRRFFSTLLLLFLVLASGVNFQFGIGTTEDSVYDYIPIKWAIIVLGGYDYYAQHSWNPIQRVEGWLYSRGVPYDIIQDDHIVAPINKPEVGKYALQYANGSLRYQVIILISNSHNDVDAVNLVYIYSAVGNGTNAIIFGNAGKLVPDLLSISPSDVTFLIDYSTPYGVNCTITKSFNDGIKEYSENSTMLVGEGGYLGHILLQNVVNKTVWYNWARKDYTGVGMMNGTYGKGNVWFNSLVIDRYDFLKASPYSLEWVDRNWALIGHSINFMFNNCERIFVSIQGYKSWKGGLVIRLDEDYTEGITAPINEEALMAGWIYDYSICALGFMRYISSSARVSEGLPEGYTGSLSSKIKNGNATGILFGTQSERNATTQSFVIYNATANSKYNRMRIDFNKNKNFSDDIEYTIWENITYKNMNGEYYWCYIDNENDPSVVDFGWWSPLRDMIPTEWLNTYRYYGERYGVTFGLHEYQHATIGNSSFRAHTYSWDGSKFVANQTYAEEMFNRARDELIYNFGGTGRGFESDEVIISHPGNEYNKMTRNAIGNLSYVLFEYGASGEYEPGFYIQKSGHPILSSGIGAEPFFSNKIVEAYIDMMKTLYSVMSVYGHGTGTYNLNYTFTPYSDMFKPANGRDLYHFWDNARYMLKNTVNAYYINKKIIFEYKANNTLKNYVWKFPIELDGKFFNGFSNNRTVGNIKHIDGKYVYIEFSEGGSDRLEAKYGSNPNIYQTSNHIKNITQIYKPKNLTLQLWNASGTLHIKVNSTRLGEPNSINNEETSLNYNYNSTTKICSFNVTLNNLTTIEILWEYAPPNPPTLKTPIAVDRRDPGERMKFTWEFSDSDPEDDQLAYRIQLSDKPDFTSPIIDTMKVSSPLTRYTQTLPNTTALYYWRVKTWDSKDVEGDWSSSWPIILDQLKVISKGATHNRADVGASLQVYFKIAREYDNTIFDGTKGTVYVNDLATYWDEVSGQWILNVTHNSIGQEKYKVTSITDNEYNITKINDLEGEQQVIWDKLIVTINLEPTTPTVGSKVFFTVTAVYAYDNNKVPEFTASILKDGIYFASNNFTDIWNSIGTHQYVIENIMETSYGLTTFSSNLVTVTWNAKTLVQFLLDWSASNSIILILIAQTVIVLSFIILRERKERKNG